jgi:hypothetical protein
MRFLVHIIYLVLKHIVMHCLLWVNSLMTTKLMTDKHYIYPQHSTWTLSIILQWTVITPRYQIMTWKENEPGIFARLRNSWANESTCSLLGTCDNVGIEDYMTTPNNMYQSTFIQGDTLSYIALQVSQYL